MRIVSVSFALVLVGMVVCSCTDKSEVSLPETFLPFKINQERFISDIVDDVRIVPLHFEGLSYYTIDKMVVRDDYYYLFDYRQKKVMVFDRSGKMEYIIARAGRGPGEYLDMKSATVDGQDIIVLDNQMRQIHRYNRFTGEYVRSNRLSFAAWDVEAFNDGSLIFAFVPMSGGHLAHAQPDNMVFITDEEGQIRECLFPIKKGFYEPMSKDSYLCSDGKRIVFSSYGFDGCVMFDCDDSGKREKVMIDFGNETTKGEERKEWAAIVKKRYLHDTPLPCGDLMGMLLGLGDETMNYFLCDRRDEYDFLQNPSSPQKNMLYMPKASYKGKMYSLIEAEEYKQLALSGILPYVGTFQDVGEGDMILAEYRFKNNAE